MRQRCQSPALHLFRIFQHRPQMLINILIRFQSKFSYLAGIFYQCTRPIFILSVRVQQCKYDLFLPCTLFFHGCCRTFHQKRISHKAKYIILYYILVQFFFLNEQRLGRRRIIRMHIFHIFIFRHIFFRINDCRQLIVGQWIIEERIHISALFQQFLQFRLPKSTHPASAQFILVQPVKRYAGMVFHRSAPIFCPIFILYCNQ